jgi:hypothetical protein
VKPYVQFLICIVVRKVVEVLREREVSDMVAVGLPSGGAPGRLILVDNPGLQAGFHLS